MNDISEPVRANTILNSISSDALERMRPAMEQVDLPIGMVICGSDEPISWVYFPQDAMISVVAHTDAGHSAEVAVIGPEGAAGLAVVLGASSTPYESMVQMDGTGWRVPAKAVQAEFERQGSLNRALLDFTQKYIVQISQIVLCNRLHSVGQRLSRWLLMCRDRSASEKMPLTQEFLSIMLGANRTTVTMTAIQLQNQGLISYSRGKVFITDRKGLEDFTCSCYDIIKKAYQKHN